MIKYNELHAIHNKLGRTEIKFQILYEGVVSRKLILANVVAKRPHSKIICMWHVSKGYVQGLMDSYDTPELFKYYTT